MEDTYSEKFCGRTFLKDEIAEISEIASSCQGLSRTELANTVCELFSWRRPTERLKTVECRQFLEYLESKGVIKLPRRKGGSPQGKKGGISRTHEADMQPPITGKAGQFSPLLLTRVTTSKQRDLWYEYIDRYHYLGYHLPFGAQLRYFIESAGTLLGCLQFSSPAWKMAPRDQWISWGDEQRKRNLQKIINNSRFLLFPWVRIRNLASSVLSLAARQVPGDWQACYQYRPVLMETLVDKSRFKGTCYRAANWVHVGTTTGRGRMDRHTRCKGQAPKEIYLYPLTRRFREELLA